MQSGYSKCIKNAIRKVNKMIERLDLDKDVEYYTDCYLGTIERIESQIDNIRNVQEKIIEKLNEIIDKINAGE